MNPFEAAVQDKAQHHCESCRHMRQRQVTDIKVEAGYDHAHHWCQKNNMPTLAQALRRGGSDWESLPSAHERRAPLH